MATRASRPVRTLLIFVAVLAVTYIAVAALGNWKPRLGLDLQGGTRITLEASAPGGSVTSDKLSQAVDIISQRVNGAGVSEAEVTTQGSDIVTVEIPGKVSNNLEKTIGQTAQLRFRVVAAAFPPAGRSQQPPTSPPTSPTPTGPTSSGPTSTGSPSSGPTSSPSKSGPTTGSVTTGPTIGPPSSTRSGNGRTSRSNERPQLHPAAAAPTQTATPLTPTSSSSPRSTSASPTRSTPTRSGATTSSATPIAGGPSTAQSGRSEFTPCGGTVTTSGYSVQPPQALQPPDLLRISDPYAWVANPPQQCLAQAASYTCPVKGKVAAPQLDIPSQPLIACDQGGNRYLLGPAVVEGTDVNNASSGIPQNQVAYAVTLSFDSSGTKAFADATTRTAKTNASSPLSGKQIAIVLDGQVLSAPTNDEPITGGQAIITGSVTNPFTQDSAASLANALKYGALPLTFTIQNTETQGPELASGQLDAGIVAGIVGLILVVGYCLLYYRGLAFVVVSSLVIAGLITYACVLLLGHAYGFTLTLPGIAGLIVAVGITADSFIVYFERLRDEVRDGKTLRTSVETGWARARNTILAADAVSILAALVLFFFAIGVVKGFAFALGLTTLIDVFVVFFFTKPVVTLLARTTFFGQGHKWSGLDRQHLGLAPLPSRPRSAGGEA